MSNETVTYPVERRAIWQWLTFERLLTVVVFVAIFAMAARFPLDSDGWWHLRSGQWMVEHGAVPRADPFSHTRFGTPWIDHGWLAQLIQYAIFAVAGFGGLVIYLSLLVTGAFAFAWLQCPAGNRWLRAFVFIIAAATSAIIWSVRPQMVSFLLTAVVAYLLYRYKQGATRSVWWLLPVMMLWANIHGGFALGFILIVAYLFGEVGNQILGLRRESREAVLSWRQIGTLFFVAVLSFLLLAINPNGIQMWGYPLRTVGIGVLQDYIVEWRSPDFHLFYLHPFIWMLLAAITSFGLAGRRADFTDLTLVAVFAYLSLLAVRNIPLFALVTAPIIVRYGTRALQRWRGGASASSRVSATTGRHFLINWLLVALVACAALLYVGSRVLNVPQEAAHPEGMPAGAVAYVAAAQPPGPLFNDYNWGGYLIWSLPDYPVFVDGRTDLYDDELLREYLAIYMAQPGWEARLDKWAINLVLAEADGPLSTALAQQQGWTQVYYDAIAAVYTRD